MAKICKSDAARSVQRAMQDLFGLGGVSKTTMRGFDRLCLIKAARTALMNAAMVALPLPALCERAWVLAQGCRTPAARIAEVICHLANAAKVSVNRPTPP